jgi:ubiquinone/menaquinone biosynthesis C-methylase UbiE
MESLNVGCGGDPWGEVRLDINRDVKPTVLADAHFLPFVNGSFDLVLSSHCLEHLNQPLQALNEIMRVTCRKIVLRFPTEEAERWLFLFFRLRRAPSHKWIIKSEVIISCLKMNDWQIETWEKGGMRLFISFETGRKAKYLRWLTKHWFETRLPWQHIIVASKINS